MREDICNVLRDRIVNLYYKPGESLNEKKLSEEFGVSRTPIREALILLSGENLVTMPPRSGVRVSDINLRDFYELIEFRLVLERGVARLAAMKAQEKHIVELQQLNEKMQLINSDNIYELVDCDTQFHQIIRKASHNSLLDKNLSVVQNQFTRIQKLISHKPDHMPTDLLQVIEALEQRDGDKMEKLMVDHVAHFVSVVRSYFKMVEF